MDYIKIGAFISEIRKEKNLTQKELAEKLNITDKAVSKWERGLSCPDTGLLIPLANVLGITVSELLNGARAEVLKQETIVQPVTDAILYSEKSSKDKKRKALWIVFFSISLALVLSALTCMICDLALNMKLTWSLIVLETHLFAWLLLMPLFTAHNRRIFKTMIVLTAGVFPFLLVLGLLLQTGDIYRLGGMIAFLSVIYTWIIYLLFSKLKSHRIAALGITFLLAAPLTLGINGYVARYINQPYLNSNRVSAISTVFVCVVLAIICFVTDFILSRRNH